MCAFYPVGGVPAGESCPLGDTDHVGPVHVALWAACCGAFVPHQPCPGPFGAFWACGRFECIIIVPGSAPVPTVLAFSTETD